MQVAITTLSAKGQVVIPKTLRKNLDNGDKFLIAKQGSDFMLKKLSKKDVEDIEFARRSDAAYERIKRGEGIRMKKEEFLKELDSW